MPERLQFELYGPLWLYITMIVEFLIVGHFQKIYNQESPPEDFVDNLAHKIGVFDYETLNANQSLHKIVSMSFIIGIFFLGVPLAQYLTLRS